MHHDDHRYWLVYTPDGTYRILDALSVPDAIRRAREIADEFREDGRRSSTKDWKARSVTRREYETY